MKIRLSVQSGSHAGKEIEVGQEKFLIGRSDSCQLRPKSESVSRKHCIIAVQEGRVLVQDLKSRNGTFVNEKRLPPDKAKVLKDGDLLRVGKLSFGVVIEHGLHAAKKPEVKSIAEAAARTHAEGSSDSRFEEVDVSSWLDEADAIDRVRKMNDPDTRHLTLQEQQDDPDTDSSELSVNATIVSDNTGSKKQTDGKVDDASGSGEKGKKFKRPEKQKPGKLPQGLKKEMTDTSRDAADDALKRFFSGR
ncbi:FHA domain-containing protein [Allorhodopirellula heiligendammensis]|uniref:Oxoglutarate dehydrogenase inhibitor n=1 Tax=Allorhodopirellula heiligendammensis TaxID=2714739 RepID=A0A5C6C0X9_9BACT|nr:FHA domain-containing protein [Allorhodopirellula heiligendammensis]TWU18210.1 Oxoglutarate dehydrogenase inhibitor [Allorhodopirellula heiligendammensis]|tara:strand:+ start:81 stop:824 length:744 start_codon:yes stop_codon:yes gene_type:complete